MLLVLALAVPATMLAQGSKGVEEQIKALQAQLFQAQMKGDISALEKFYADDAIIVHSEGKRSTKAQEIANIKSGSQKYESTDVLDQTIRIYGNTAVANTVTATKAIVGGKPVVGKTNAARVWVKQKGDWKLVLYHVMRVPLESQ